MISQLAPRNACVATNLLVDCALQSPEGDSAAWTMRRLEEAFMEAIVAGESDPAIGHQMTSNLLSVLPLMVDSDSENGRLRHFARAVARTALRQAAALGNETTTQTRDFLKLTSASHTAPCLQGMVEALSLT